MIPDPNYPYDIWFILDFVISALSLLGGLVMAYFCWKTPVPRSTSIKFMIGIGLSDAAFSVSNIMSAFETKDSHGFCMTEAILKEISFLLTIIFSTCTAIVAAKASQPSSFNSKLFFGRTLVFGTLVSVLFALG